MNTRWNAKALNLLSSVFDDEPEIKDLTQRLYNMEHSKPGSFSLLTLSIVEVLVIKEWLSFCEYIRHPENAHKLAGANSLRILVEMGLLYRNGQLTQVGRELSLLIPKKDKND